jgi:hypothetical protein
MATIARSDAAIFFEGFTIPLTAAPGWWMALDERAAEVRAIKVG